MRIDGARSVFLARNATPSGITKTSSPVWGIRHGNARGSMCECSCCDWTASYLRSIHARNPDRAFTSRGRKVSAHSVATPHIVVSNERGRNHADRRHSPSERAGRARINRENAMRNCG